MEKSIGENNTEYGLDPKRRERLVLIAALLIAAGVVVRAFFGVDVTDESFYLSDALAMLHGNLPYALNNFFLASGYAFLPLPLLFLYERLVPDCEGIVLFSRLCFLAFHFLCVFVAARVLGRHVTRTSARLYACCMLPCICNWIVNFNYNSIPLVLLCTVAILLFDAVERDGRGARATLFLSGFLSAVAVFANPAYACAVILNLLLIPLCAREGKRLASLLLYMAGGILGILIVAVPLLMQAGPQLLWEGIEGMITNKFPREARDNAISVGRRILQLGWIGFWETIVFLIAFLSVPLLRFFNRRAGRELPDRRSLFRFGIAAGFCLLLIGFILGDRDYYCLSELGIAGAACLVLVLLTERGSRARLLLFLGLYPTVYALTEVFFTSGQPTERFFNCLPVVFCVLMSLRESEDRRTRLLAAVGMSLCIALQLFSLYNEPYRDSPVWELDTRVESGVYKGLYTVKQRAEDLPRMEEYLNGIVEETDSYAFRDCFPGGYLMVHRGQICDITSWDVLQYSYGLNTPSRLFDYYKRRDSIPSVIVYVNYGRDKLLSAEDERVRYNDFLNAYYELEDERFPDGMFDHIMVFRYAGGFDGDYESWIDAYNFVSPEGNLFADGQ